MPNMRVVDQEEKSRPNRFYFPSPCLVGTQISNDLPEGAAKVQAYSNPEQNKKVQNQTKTSQIGQGTSLSRFPNDVGPQRPHPGNTRKGKKKGCAQIGQQGLVLKVGQVFRSITVRDEASQRKFRNIV